MTQDELDAKAEKKRKFLASMKVVPYSGPKTDPSSLATIRANQQRLANQKAVRKFR